MAGSRRPRPKPSALSREARQRTASPERLRELAEHPETHRALAHNPATPADVLRRLAASSDHAIVRTVATNREAPDDLLRELADRADERIGRAMAKRVQLPDEVCVQLSASPHYQVQWAIVCRKELPHEAIDVLARSPESTIRRKLVRHPSAPPTTLAMFAADPDPTWALDALQHRGLGAETIAALARHPDPAVRTTATEVLAQADDDAQPDAATTGVQKPKRTAIPVPPQAKLRQMLVSPDHRERTLAVEKIESLTPSESAFVAEDVCWLVRQAAARRSDTGPDALERLANDPTIEVQVAVAHNRNTPAAVLLRLADTRHVKVAGRLARNANTSPATLEYLAKRWTVVRTSIANHPQVPTELLWTMANEPAPRGLRAAIAKSANVDHRICMKAAHDLDAWVRRSLATNEKATAEALALLVDDDNTVRVKLAANPTTPGAVLRQLGADPNPNVRKAVAHNSGAPAADRVLAALL